MKHHPPTDPLLDAVLANDVDSPASSLRANSLAILVTGACRRRRQILTRRVLGAIAVPLLVAVLVWPQSSKTIPKVSSVTVVHSRTHTELRVVESRASGMEMAKNVPGVEVISTPSTLPDVELASGDSALLALVPGSAGFIGDGSERRLVWFAQ